MVARLLIVASVLLVVVTLPFSLCLVIKVVQVHDVFLHMMMMMMIQEYEKTVIFRLGRILTGGARGPGVFFIIPCVDIYEVIDMRVQNFSVPPQEVRHCENKQALQGGLSNCERLQIKYQMKCAGIDYYELEKEA